MKSILLVDDDETNRVVLSALLEDYGFPVALAASFREARERLDATGAAYNVVLLDQHLGDGLGTDLIPGIRNRHPDAKVILISGSIDRRDPRGAAADSIVTKGASFTDLLALIEPAKR